MLEAIKVNINDASLLFEWVNDKDVRNNAINTNQIKWEDHLDWLNRKIADENCTIYIIYDKEEAIGQVRFENFNDNYLIDYSLDKKHRNRRLGKPLLLKAIQKLDILNIKKKTFTGIVKTGNIASVKTFQGLKFIEISTEEDTKKGLRVFQLYASNFSK